MKSQKRYYTEMAKITEWVESEWDRLGYSAHNIGLPPEKQAQVDAVAQEAADRRKKIVEKYLFKWKNISKGGIDIVHKYFAE